LAGRIPALYDAPIREILPRATSDHPGNWEQISMAGVMPKLDARRHVTLSRLIVGNEWPVAGDGLRYFGLLEVPQLVNAVSGSVGQGYSTLFQPDVIRDVRCRQSGAASEGSIGKRDILLCSVSIRPAALRAPANESPAFIRLS